MSWIQYGKGDKWLLINWAIDFLLSEWWAVSFCTYGATVDASSVDPHVVYPEVVPSRLEGVSVFLQGSSVIKIEQ